jgi:hypothetical protein
MGLPNMVNVALNTKYVLGIGEMEIKFIVLVSLT